MQEMASCINRHSLGRRDGNVIPFSEARVRQNLVKPLLLNEKHGGVAETRTFRIKKRLDVSGRRRIKDRIGPPPYVAHDGDTTQNDVPVGVWLTEATAR